MGVMLRRVPHWSRPLSLLISLSLILLISLLDFITGPGLSFAIFYLAPIVVVAWFLGKWWGLLTAVVSVVLCFLSDTLVPAAYPHPLTPVWNAGTRFGFFVVVVFLLSTLKDKLKEAETRSMTDALTGILNVRGFQLIAAVEIAKAHREDTPLSVAYIDLDDFKAVNDQRGHHEGDKALQLIAKVMSDNMRQTDTVARLGGDEFVILLPKTEPSMAYEVIARLRDVLLEAMQERDYPITFSIGLATFTLTPASAEMMLETADKLMYDVKREGKNQIRHQVYDGLDMPSTRHNENE